MLSCQTCSSVLVVAERNVHINTGTNWRTNSWPPFPPWRNNSKRLLYTGLLNCKWRETWLNIISSSSIFTSTALDHYILLQFYMLHLRAFSFVPPNHPPEIPILASSILFFKNYCFHHPPPPWTFHWLSVWGVWIFSQLTALYQSPGVLHVITSVKF